jgi:hypothetical protein
MLNSLTVKNSALQAMIVMTAAGNNHEKHRFELTVLKQDLLRISCYSLQSFNLNGHFACGTQAKHCFFIVNPINN